MIIDMKGKLMERDPQDDPITVTKKNWNELCDYLQRVENRLQALESKAPESPKKSPWRRIWR